MTNARTNVQNILPKCENVTCSDENNLTCRKLYSDP